MKSKHIAFCVEPAYGHVMPTLGITLELQRRGHTVSYAVTEAFAPVIDKVKAQTKIIYPLDNRTKMVQSVVKENDSFSWNTVDAETQRVIGELTRERTAKSLSQLIALYQDDKPDVIIHNNAQDTVGCDLATQFGIAKIRHQTQFVDFSSPLMPGLEFYKDDELVLLAVPEFFQPARDRLDRRFQFVGFTPEGRNDVFDRWQHPSEGKRPILISPTTGELPQVAFCRMMIDCFRDQPWPVVLSISGLRDVISAIEPDVFTDLPGNFRLNWLCGNFDILETCCLYIGQGGQGGVLEALFHALPQIVIPPTPYHHSVARRVGELGVGVCLPISELSKEAILNSVSTALQDDGISQRVQEAARSMRQERGAELAADLIENYLGGH